jgi:hypothetical protein
MPSIACARTSKASERRESAGLACADARVTGPATKIALAFVRRLITLAPMSEEPSDDEILRRARVTPTNKKPASVWIAQFLCAFGGVGTLYFTIYIESVPTKIVMGLLGLLYLGLLYGAEKRQNWSRWVIAALFAMGAVSTLLQALQDPTGQSHRVPGQLEIKPEEQSGAAAGRAAAIVLIFLLAGRLAFGDPAKRYFGRASEPKPQP